LLARNTEGQQCGRDHQAFQQFAHISHLSPWGFKTGCLLF
jgi:hypothetical protein